MIVNVPLSIDAESIENALKNDCERWVSDRMDAMLRQSFINYKGNSTTGYEYVRSNVQKEIDSRIYSLSEKFFYEHADEMLDKIVDRVSQKVQNSKKFKDAITIVINTAKEE